MKSLLKKFIILTVIEYDHEYSVLKVQLIKVLQGGDKFILTNLLLGYTHKNNPKKAYNCPSVRGKNKRPSIKWVGSQLELKIKKPRP